jgi:hypothetical protein
VHREVMDRVVAMEAPEALATTLLGFYRRLDD